MNNSATTSLARSTRALVAFAILLVCAVGAIAGASYNVTGTIYNYDANNNAYQLQGDSTPSATYAPKGSISSALTPSSGSGTLRYEWRLDLQNSSRSFYVTLNSLDGSTPPFVGPLAFNGALLPRCFDSSGANVDWTTIRPGYPDGTCAMRIQFIYNGTQYALVMSPEFAGTGTAMVSCTNWSTAANSCVAWSEVPNSAAPNAYVADLIIPNGGGNNIPTILGKYALNFSVAVTH